VVARRGSGGAGIVYRAIDDRLGRTVAVKVLQRGLADDPVFLRRFRDEAQAAAQLNHPNIMKVFDWGSDEGEPYLVMEYLANGSLRELWARGVRLTRPQVIRLGQATASALAYSHTRNLLHRDIKPANLLFDEEGRVRIADFGLVRALSETTVTDSGSGLVGTPRYMSPEQVEGTRSLPASDVYSLGLVLYEALTGAIPFTGDTQLALAFARLRQPIPQPDPDDKVLVLVCRMLELRPESRPSAAEVEEAFDHLARELGTGQPIAALFDAPTTLTPEAIMDDSLQWVHATRAVGGEGATILLEVEAPSRTSTLPEQPGRVQAQPVVAPPGVTNGPSEVGRHRRWWLVAPLVVLLAALGYGGYLAWQRLRVVQLPRVGDLTAAQAVATMHSDGLLSVTTAATYSASVPEGRVVGSAPPAGTRVRADRRVIVLVSRGHAPVFAASFVGAPFARAKASFARLGLVVDPTYRYSPDVPTGVVMSESPVNRKVAFGSRVTFVVSKGPAPRPVPNVTGDSLSGAEAALKAQGFAWSVSKQYSDSVSAGDVISQGTAAGTVEPFGTTIALVDSLGPHYVQVPNVIGDSLSQAESTLQSAGFVIGTVSAPFGGSTVQYQSPGGGQTVLYGATVNLLVIP
jgi:beta-lactam-binding protein with PASTA domain